MKIVSLETKTETTWKNLYFFPSKLTHKITHVYDIQSQLYTIEKLNLKKNIYIKRKLKPQFSTKAYYEQTGKSSNSKKRANHSVETGKAHTRLAKRTHTNASLFPHFFCIKNSKSGEWVSL